MNHIKWVMSKEGVASQQPPDSIILRNVASQVIELWAGEGIPTHDRYYVSKRVKFECYEALKKANKSRMQLAAGEYQRMIRLPNHDPANQLMSHLPPAKLKSRAHEAWRREVEKAEAERRPPPKPPGEDAVLPHRPCIRRVAHWMWEGAGLKDLQAEPMELYRGRPP